MREVSIIKPINFGEKLVDSKAFLALFREGMSLVEDVACYLDGEGREDVKALSRQSALTYATESMRLTTRLMQLASWLLLQRALNDGELSASQVRLEKSKVRLEGAGGETPVEIVAELPPALQYFITKTKRLQQRLVHLEKNSQQGEIIAQESAVQAQFNRLNEAFSR